MSLNRHPPGSIKQLWSIAFPLMLFSLSMLCMLFVDRLFLAHYSTAALNAAVNAATFGWVFVGTGIIMTSIAEVFVAQYNGAGWKDRLGEPVWQMIWLSIASFAFFIPLGMINISWIYGPDRQMEQNYFQWMMVFCPFALLYGALCSFFIGQGKTSLVTWLAIIANLLNAILDLVLIFGIDGWIPSLGITGAAIATNGSSVFQVIVLFCFFLKKSNRDQFNTHKYALDLSLLNKCLKVGFPGALVVGIEILGWAIFYEMMSKVSEMHITLAGICQSITILFYFFCEGISKGAATIAGNFIGAKEHYRVPFVLKSGVILHFCFFIFLLVTLIFGSELVLNQFLSQSKEYMTQSFYNTASFCLILIVFHLLFEGLRLLISGLLTAAGDTVFLLIAGSTSLWVLMVIPSYIIVVRNGAPPAVGIGIWVFYSVGAALLYYWRFNQGKWRTISLTV